jgi:hypothetical protein
MPLIGIISLLTIGTICFTVIVLLAKDWVTDKEK